MLEHPSATHQNCIVLPVLAIIILLIASFSLFHSFDLQHKTTVYKSKTVLPSQLLPPASSLTTQNSLAEEGLVGCHYITPFLCPLHPIMLPPICIQAVCTLDYILAIIPYHLMAAAIDFQEAVWCHMLGTMDHALWTRIELCCLGLEGQSLSCCLFLVNIFLSSCFSHTLFCLDNTLTLMAIVIVSQESKLNVSM
jgi:hypothetical protein